MEEDVPILKQKKRKVAIDPDQEDDENVQAVVTKTQEESVEREKYEHKTNGDKKPEVKKQPEKKEESKPKKEENKAAAPAKPKPTSEKEKSNTQKENEQKAKPNSVSSEKKPSDTNGQQAKKAPEEKKAVAKPASQPVKRRKDESESEESDSESEDEKPKRKKTPVKKEPAKKEPVRSGGKDELVYNVLKRWWYCLPEWPPANFDYSAELQKRNLRKVDFKYWRVEKDVDEKGFKKVYEIPSYPGVFKNAQGENVDLRPRENCPCYEVMKKKSLDELLELLSKALKNQIEALEKSGNNDEEIMKDLQRELKRAEKTIASRKK